MNPFTVVCLVIIGICLLVCLGDAVFVVVKRKQNKKVNSDKKEDNEELKD